LQVEVSILLISYMFRIDGKEKIGRKKSGWQHRHH